MTDGLQEHRVHSSVLDISEADSAMKALPNLKMNIPRSCEQPIICIDADRVSNLAGSRSEVRLDRGDHQELKPWVCTQYLLLDLEQWDRCESSEGGR